MASSALEDNDVHKSVARLSITEETSGNDRVEFLKSLKNQSLLAESETVIEESSTSDPPSSSESPKKPTVLTASTSQNENPKLVSTTKKKKKKGEKLVLTLEPPKIQPTKKAKRRRSSVQQGSQIRRKKFLMDDPTFELDLENEKNLTFGDIRSFILYSLTNYQYSPPFCKIDNRISVDQVVFIFVPGLITEDFGVDSFQSVKKPLKVTDKCPFELPILAEKFEYAIPLQAPGSKKSIFSCYHTLTSVPFTRSEKRKMSKESEQNKITILDLLLTPEELLGNGYPIHPKVAGISESLFSLRDEYRPTVEFEHDGSKTFALDCEMCQSKSGKVLTRVSLTDFDGKVLIDELVKPDEEIIDYVTKYSGISEDMLKDVETTSTDVQNMILNTVSCNDVLIGHSLESDLKVLKISHPRIVDTALCFDHPRGPPSKASLKSLMELHLNQKIQGNAEGHDSIEDANSCMELVKLKIAKGLLFGKVVSENSIFERIAQTKKIRMVNGNKAAKTSLVIDYVPVSKSKSCEQRIQSTTDDEVVENFRIHRKEDDFVILKLRELEFFKGFTPNSMGMKLPSTLSEAYSNLNKRLTSIYETTSDNSFIIICSGNGNLKDMVKLQQIYKTYQYEFQKDGNKLGVEAWTEEKAEELAKACNKARDALFMVCLKKPTDKSGDSAIVE